MSSTANKLVQPADIQATLNKIWESLETKSVARASLFNLIFFTQKNSRTPYFQKIASKVVEKFPSRVIFISVDKNAKEDFLKTEVSILSSSKGEFDVACDYIQFEAAGASQARIPFIVLPHILPDLPVYLVLAEDPSKEDPLTLQLEQFAQRLIFDSESTDNLPRFASSILKHYELSHTDIADLNWARTESWRDLMSMIFYSPQRLQQIQRAKSLNITFNAHESQFFCHTRIQAIYVSTWLACQLGWKFLNLRFDKDLLIFNYQTPASNVEITLAASDIATLPPGLILDLELTTLDSQKFSFNRNREQIHQITIQISDATMCALPAHYFSTKVESGHSLVKEIGHRGTSSHYLKVLQQITQMQMLGIC